MSSDKVIEDIYGLVKQTIKEQPTRMNITIIAARIILLVQQNESKFASGEEKKQAVIKLIKLLISDSSLPILDKFYLNQFVESTLPLMIDVMISIAKKKISLGKSSKNYTSCFCL